MSAPPVPLNEVEWRVDGPASDGRNGGKQCRFVPYVNAPIVSRLLDEWVGEFRWQDRYEPTTLDGKPALFCFLSIRTDDGEWVTKEDVGVPSNFEGQKGMVSDAFKRAACLKWGVARNVYDLPTLWAPCELDRKGNPRPSKDSLPAILRQLKQKGYEATGGQVAAPDAHDDGEAAPVASESSQPADVGADPDTALCPSCKEPLGTRPLKKQDGVVYHKACADKADDPGRPFEKEAASA